ADNTAGADGGGLFNTPHGHALVLGSEFLGNQAAFGGGLANLGTLAVVGSTVAENQAALDGGGIWSGHRLLLLDVLFADNSPNAVPRLCPGGPAPRKATAATGGGLPEPSAGRVSATAARRRPPLESWPPCKLEDRP